MKYLFSAIRALFYTLYYACYYALYCIWHFKTPSDVSVKNFISEVNDIFFGTDEEEEAPLIEQMSQYSRLLLGLEALELYAEDVYILNEGSGHAVIVECGIDIWHEDEDELLWKLNRAGWTSDELDMTWKFRMN